MQNFGRIHETFKNILANGIVTKDPKAKTIFKAYLKILKENKTLKGQYHIFNKLENKSNEDSETSSLYVDECISILSNLDRDKINEVNNKLIKYLTKNNYPLSIGYDLEILHEHISKLAFTKKSIKNVNSIIESKKFLNEYVNGEILIESTFIEPYANKFLGPVMIEKFNNKYKDLLSESDKKIFRSIINSNNDSREDIFKSSVVECIDSIDMKLNEECTIEEKDKLLRVKDKLLRLKYNSENFISEITKITVLKNSLN